MTTLAVLLHHLRLVYWGPIVRGYVVDISLLIIGVVRSHWRPCRIVKCAPPHCVVPRALRRRLGGGFTWLSAKNIMRGSATCNEDYNAIDWAFVYSLRRVHHSVKASFSKAFYLHVHCVSVGRSTKVILCVSNILAYIWQLYSIRLGWCQSKWIYNSQRTILLLDDSVLNLSFSLS